MTKVSLTRRCALGLALAATGILGACAGQAGGVGFVARATPTALPADQLRAVSLEGFRGIVSGQRGKPVVVNIWASWCGPCRVEAPLLQRAATHYGGRVTFIGVNAQDAYAPATQFLRRYAIRYTNVVDAEGDVTGALSLRGFPTTYIFDRTGRVRFSVVGGISEQTLAARLEQLLA